jgi:hypothetical protein
MGRSFKDVVASLPQTEQAAIEAQSDELKKEYMALKDIRKTMNLSQKEVSRTEHK